MDEKKPVNPEEVEYTLKEIRAEQDAKNSKKTFWEKTWDVLCWPFRQIKRFIKFVASKIPVPITAKTTINDIFGFRVILKFSYQNTAHSVKYITKCTSLSIPTIVLVRSKPIGL